MKWLLFLVPALVFSCHTAKKNTGGSANQSIDFSAGPPTVIYLTRIDCFDKIPITLNDERTKIISYPAPSDIYYNGNLSYPTKLNHGYLLDNRGIGKNSVFLNITYENYSKLKEAPSLSEMTEIILDKNPFTEIYDCGSRYQYTDIVLDLNKMY
mgnify:CR=1 FL=1